MKMIYFIMILIFVIGVFSGRSSCASELTLDAITYQVNASNHSSSSIESEGYLISYKFDNEFTLGYEKRDNKITHYIDGYTIKQNGILAGFTQQVNKNFSWFLLGGYYINGNDWGERYCNNPNGAGCNEGIYYLQNHDYVKGHRPKRFDGHVVEVENSWGGLIGGRYQKYIGKSWKVGLTGGYAVNKVRVREKSRAEGGTSIDTNPYYYSEGVFDLGGAFFAFNVGKRFN